MSVDLLLHGRADGVSVLLSLTSERLPVIHHWGADLGSLTAEDARSAVIATDLKAGNNDVDTALTPSVLPEQWTGWKGRPGLSGSRQGRDFSPVFAPVEVTLDGESAEGYAQTDGFTLTVVSRCERTQLQLVLELEFTAQGILRQRAQITNLGESYQVDDLVLTAPLPIRATQVLDFAGRWGLERAPQRSHLDVGTHLRENRKGRTGSDSAYLLHLAAPGLDFASGEVWTVHTGWSGNHTHYAERLWTGVGVLGGGELLESGEVILGQGESYTSPWLYFAYGQGLDQVARRFHRLLRARDNHVRTVRPVTINVWEAVYFDHDFDRLADLARRAAALGIERYVLDDGWFGSRRNDFSGLGDWVVSEDVWPDGLGKLVDLVRGLGMQFGLWFEPEMINADSDVARAHPEWVMAADPQRWPLESRHQQVFNLAIPEAYAHVRDQMMAILDEYPIDYIKWDHNRDLVEAGNQLSGRPSTHEQTLATYRLMDELKAAHPGLEIESCSSGGSRVDLGVLEHTDRVWVSDNIDPFDRQQMNRWTTQLLPPELMGTHVASGVSHTTGRVNSLAFRGASAMFGHLGVEWDLAKATDEELAELGDWISLHKQLRDLLHGGDLVRLDLADPIWVGHGVVSPDQSRAVFSIALLDVPPTSGSGRLQLAGLDPERRYRVTPLLSPLDPRQEPAWVREPLTLTGGVLQHSGLELPMLRPAQALVFQLEQVN